MAGSEPPSSADAPEEGSFNIATWRIVLLFLGILIVDTLWEYLDERITSRIASRKSKGLLHAWEQLKFEVMSLGLVSLLLVVFEVCHCFLHGLHDAASSARQRGFRTRYMVTLLLQIRVLLHIDASLAGPSAAKGLQAAPRTRCGAQCACNISSRARMAPLTIIGGKQVVLLPAGSAICRCGVLSNMLCNVCRSIF